MLKATYDLRTLGMVHILSVNEWTKENVNLRRLESRLNIGTFSKFIVLVYCVNRDLLLEQLRDILRWT